MRHLRLFEEYFDDKVITFEQIDDLIKSCKPAQIREVVMKIIKEHEVHDSSLEVDYEERVSSPNGAGESSGIIVPYNRIKRILALFEFRMEQTSSDYMLGKTAGYPFELFVTCLTKDEWKEKKMMHTLTVQGIDNDRKYYLYVGNAYALAEKVYKQLFFAHRKEIHKKFGM